MQITKITFIGSSAEYNSVRHLFEEPAAAPQTATDDARLQQPTEETSYEDILQALRYRPLLPRHQQLLKVLYDQPDDYLSRSELATRLQITPEQLNGVLGALARHIRRIPNLRGSAAQSAPLRVLLDVIHENGEWQYRLHPDTRKALEAEGLV